MSEFKRSRKDKNGKKKEYWYIRYRLNGKDKWESVGEVGIVTKAVARAFLDERKRQIRRGELNMIGAKIPTLSNFTKEYIRYQKEVKQKRSWERDLIALNNINKHFGDKKLSEITIRDIDDYKELRLKHVTPGTVNRELQVLRHLFNQAASWDKFFNKNPVSESGLLSLNNQVERILTYEEEQRLLTASPAHLKAILICALNTGMRKGEIITLKWCNVDFDNNLITIDHENNKSKRTKRIPINSTLRQLLLELKLKSGGNEHVFLNSNNEPYTRQDSLNRVFERIKTLAKIKALRFHDLRHTAATRMIENGANIVAVSKILGHSDIKTTMRYAHPDETIFDAVNKLSTTK